MGRIDRADPPFYENWVACAALQQPIERELERTHLFTCSADVHLSVALS